MKKEREKGPHQVAIGTRDGKTSINPIEKIGYRLKWIFIDKGNIMIV